MADFNPLSPVVQGLEFRPGQEQGGQFKVNNGGLLERIRPGAVTPSAVHSYLRDVIGAPGLGVEIIDAINPARTDEVHFPGIGTGAVAGGWQDETGAAATFGKVAKQYDDTTYLKNGSALGLNSKLQLQFRGNDTALASKRIGRVQIWARVQYVWPSFSSPQVRIRGQVNLSGTDYTYDPGHIVACDNLVRTVKVADWQLNPSTRLPWTMAQANLLLSTTATDEFGLEADQANVALGALRVTGLWLVVTTAAENRRGFFYAQGPPRVGWAKNTLSATVALSANTYYWLLVYALRGSLRDYFTVPVLYMPGEIIQTDPTATGEHRLGSAALLTGPSGIIDSVAADVPGTMMPFLLDVSGTINTQSQPYAKFDPLTFDSSQPANRGTQITSAAGSNAYAGVSLPVGWADPNTPPDQPLVVEVRYGAGMLTGAGTLLATATLPAQANPSWPGVDPAMADTFIAFDGGNATPPAATQLFVLVKSAASLGKGWKVPRLDSRSDNLSSGGGTTAANVEGTTQGGTTDAYSETGTPNTRFDMQIGLIGPPVAPSGPSATVVVAA